MNILGFDPSYNNIGLAHFHLDDETGELNLLEVDCFKQLKHAEAKKNYRIEKHIQEGMLWVEQKCREHGANLLVIEYPTGAQSANAAISWVTSIAYFSQISCTKIAVTPQACKKYVRQYQEVEGKKDTIHFVNERYPDRLNKYITYAEHEADAVIAVLTYINQKLKQ